jgi:hypothetical protein
MFSSDPVQLLIEFPASFHLLPSRTQATSPQAFSRKQFNVRSPEFLRAHKDANWIHQTSLTKRHMSTKRHIFPPLLHIVSQVSDILHSRTLGWKRRRRHLSKPR